jgi:hypothetical protein
VTFSHRYLFIIAPRGNSPDADNRRFVVNVLAFDPITKSADKIEGLMKRPICIAVITMSLFCGSNVTAYSGELWLSQANQRSMLALGFLAGVVHSWNNRQETNAPKLCFNAPADQMKMNNLMSVVKNYVEERNPDLQIPAQGLIRVAMMRRFPCRADH